ncbi:unnamed protein product, partial [Scytosiphon promiscuus]
MKINILLKKFLNFNDFFQKQFLKIGLLLFSILFVNCNSDSENKQEASLIPTQEYKNVFKPLDGSWKGKFYVYADKRGQTKEAAQPNQIDEKYFKKLPLKEELVIEVEQTYISESPYLQKVKITDIYPQPNGERKTVESEGFNKVENGKLICVVNKPDEQ